MDFKEFEKRPVAIVTSAGFHMLSESKQSDDENFESRESFIDKSFENHRTLKCFGRKILSYWWVSSLMTCQAAPAYFTHPLILYAAFFFNTFVREDGWNILIIQIANVSAVLAILYHVLAMFRDPGCIPDGFKGTAENIRRLKLDLDIGDIIQECVKCDSLKPPMTHHCSKCRRCIYRMDHHCYYINNCVGGRNMKQFLLFNWWTMILCTAGSFVSWVTLLTWLRSDAPWFDAASLWRQFLWSMFMSECMWFNMICSMAFYFELEYMMFGTSKIDHMKSPSEFRKLKQQPPKYSFCTVLKSVFGSNVLEWIHPLYTPPSFCNFTSEKTCNI